MLRNALALIGAAAALATPAAGTSASPAGTGSMWFADRYATAYYQLDQKTGEVRPAVLPGPQGGNAMETRRRLAEGESASITLRGTGSNEIAVTLNVTRTGTLRAAVETRVPSGADRTN